MGESKGLNFCKFNGLLVGGKLGWVPAEEYDFLYDESSEDIGCNRIRCTKCESSVKHKTGYSMGSFSAEDLKERAQKLSENSDWDSLEFLKKDRSGEFRIYYCKCNSFETMENLPLERDNRGMYSSSIPVSWKCEGHPSFQTPETVYQLEIKDAADIAKLCEQVVKGKIELSDDLPTKEVNPEGFLLTRLYYHLPDGELKTALEDALSAFLTADKPLPRFVALLFAERYPKSPPAEKVLDAYKESPKNFGDIPHPHRSKKVPKYLEGKYINMETQFFRTVLSILKATKSNPEKEFVREQLLAGKPVPKWEEFSKEIGGKWINDNFEEIYKSSPENALKPLLTTQLKKKTEVRKAQAERLKDMELVSKEIFSKKIPYGFKLKYEDLN